MACPAMGRSEPQESSYKSAIGSVGVADHLGEAVWMENTECSEVFLLLFSCVVNKEGQVVSHIGHCFARIQRHGRVSVL